MSQDVLKGGTLHRLVFSAGRTIGDNNCSYDRFGLAVLSLETQEGLVGLGYGEAIWLGTFQKDAYYIQPMLSLGAMQQSFQQSIWPLLLNKSLSEAFKALASQPAPPERYLQRAVEMALWDLQAKSKEMPLYRLLGGNQNRVPAYGSLLDFPMSDEEAVAKTKQYLAQGFRVIKVKIGAKDPARDLARLKLIRETTGPDIEITADANIAWDAPTTLQRLEAFDAQGINLGYLEDPIPANQVEGYRLLAREAKIDLVAHDYVNHLDQVRALLETGALSRIRSGNVSQDHIHGLVALAKEFDVGIIYGNSLFEMNVHPACGLPRTDRIEFSDLAWNDLLEQPVRFEGGYAYAPEVPGHGLVLREEALREYRCDEGPLS